jgi:hypothetical protein
MKKIILGAFMNTTDKQLKTAKEFINEDASLDPSA